MASQKLDNWTAAPCQKGEKSSPHSWHGCLTGSVFTRTLSEIVPFTNLNTTILT